MGPDEKARPQGPCSGFTVLEVATMVSGPLAGQILADLGADVIKLEAFDGDVVRTVPPLHKGFSGAFEQWNRNKRSLAVNLKSDEGRDIARTLALSVDSLIENYRPGVADAMGIGYDALKAGNPKLVYLSVNGFGDDGPYAGQPAYDAVLQGLVGFMPLQGDKANPKAIRSAVVDKIAGISGAMGVIAALLQRDRAGGQYGQKVNIKMLDAFATFILPEHLYNHTFQYEPLPERDAEPFPYETFKTANGYCVGLLENDDKFRQACIALGWQDILKNLPAADDDQRLQLPRHIVEQFAELAMTLATETLIGAIAGSGMMFFPINDLNGFFSNAQTKHNNSIIEFEDLELGRIRQVNTFARFSKTPAFAFGRAPKLSEQADDILRGFGISDCKIKSYRMRGIIR